MKISFFVIYLRPYRWPALLSRQNYDELASEAGVRGDGRLSWQARILAYPNRKKKQ